MGFRLIVLLFISSFMLVACTNSNLETSQLNKKEMASLEIENLKEKDIVGEIHGSLKTYEFPEAVNEAELVADIEILEKYREHNKENHVPKTTFKVIVNQVLKGDENLVNKTITVNQQGNSKWIFNGNKLFKKGEKYILFMKETKEDTTVDYWILGEETGMYKIVSETTAIKLSKKEEALASIELPDNADENAKEEITKNSGLKNYQIVNYEQLKEKILEELRK